MTRLCSSRDASRSPRSALTSEESLGRSITSFNTHMVPEAFEGHRISSNRTSFPTGSASDAPSTSETSGDNSSAYALTAGGVANSNLARFLESWQHDLYDEDLYADCIPGSMFMDCARRVGGGEATHQQQASNNNKPYDVTDDELLRQSSVACREYVRAKQDLTTLANHLLQSLPADEAGEGSISDQENYILSTLTSIKRHITPPAMRSMREFPTSFAADGEFL